MKRITPKDLKIDDIVMYRFTFDGKLIAFIGKTTRLKPTPRFKTLRVIGVDGDGYEYFIVFNNLEDNEELFYLGKDIEDLPEFMV